VYLAASAIHRSYEVLAAQELRCKCVQDKVTFRNGLLTLNRLNKVRTMYDRRLLRKQTLCHHCAIVLVIRLTLRASAISPLCGCTCYTPHHLNMADAIIQSSSIGALDVLTNIHDIDYVAETFIAPKWTLCSPCQARSPYNPHQLWNMLAELTHVAADG